MKVLRRGSGDERRDYVEHGEELSEGRLLSDPMPGDEASREELGANVYGPSMRCMLSSLSLVHLHLYARAGRDGAHYPRHVDSFGECGLLERDDDSRGNAIDSMAAQMEGACRSWRGANGSLRLRMAQAMGGRSREYAVGAHGIGGVLGALRMGLRDV